MGQAIDILDDIVRDELPRMLVDVEPEVAPIFEKIKRTAFGVKSQDGLGKTYQVIHIYATGMSGSFENADPLGPDMTSIAGNQAQMLALGSAESGLSIFPSATSVPHTGEVKRTLALHKIVGNYSVPAAWKQLDMLNAAQLKKVARDLRAVAKQKALYEAASFHSYSATNSAGYQNQVLSRISAVENASSKHSDWTNYILITLDEAYGRIANFGKGQKVDIIADSSGTLQVAATADTSGDYVRNYTYSTTKYVHLIVVDVDPLGKKICLRPINSDTGGIPTYESGYRSGNTVCGSAGDWIVAKGSAGVPSYTASRPVYSWGLLDWIKDSGQILGGADGASGLDLDIYSMFKSQVVNVAGSLTDDTLNRYIAGYLDSYPGETLDTIITSQGVQQQWLKQPGLYNNRQNYERTGKSLKMKGGWSAVEYEWGGRTFEWIVSPMCLTGNLFALKFKGDNILRYGPPRIGGADASMGPELEFLATLGGHTGVFMIARSSTGQPQDLLEAPFWYYNLIAPVDPRGIRLYGLTEAVMN